jgi:glycine/D-amino acid oxidase-like deaminating enzyme
MPLVGPVPGSPHAWLATGHGTKGIHLAAVTARLMGDYITEAEIDPEVPADAILPDRFVSAQASG